MADVSAIPSDGFQTIAARWQKFSRWWLSELRAAIPSSWIDGEALPRLLVWRDRDLMICKLTSPAGTVETQLPLHRFGLDALRTWLAECGFRRDQVIVGPVIGRDLFLRRDLSVPKAALGALPKILEQEVLRRTPFQLSDIWHAAVPSGDETGAVIAMYHWIIRKDHAMAALAELGLDISEIDFLAASDADASVPVIFFRAVVREDPYWARRAVKMLAVGGLCAVMLGLVAFEWCQASTASGIEESLFEAREGALGGHSGPNEAAHLFAKKADASVLEVWEELSRVLPDDTFLSEFRIADDKVTLSGFSSDAARLVRIIDRSPMFSGASLIAAITPDAAEDKDRFGIGFKVRGERKLRSSVSVRGQS